jgi:hypothetical protein
MGITNNTRKKRSSEKQKKLKKTPKKRTAKYTRPSNFSKKKKLIDSYRYYYNNCKGTDIIPVSSIINYMKQHYDEFQNESIQKQQEGKDIVYLDDLFDFKDALIPGLRQFTFDSPVDGKNFSLDRIIGYLFCFKTRSTFIDSDKPTDQHKYLERLKYQMGKDIKRIDTTINGKEYPGTIYFKEGDNDQEKSYYNAVDKYYQLLINYFYKIDKIDYNIINKIALLSCQNIWNFLTVDLFNTKLNYIIKPEMGTINGGEKNINIIIKKHAITMQFNFDSKLIISRNWEQGEGMDPEYPCGVLSFKFLIDFTNNTFKFIKLKFEYNLDNCGPPINNNANGPNDANGANGANGENGANGSNIKLQYAIPVALGVGAAIATPLLLGALGGKKNTKMKKNIIKNKNKKHIKHNKTKNIKI